MTQEYHENKNKIGLLYNEYTINYGKPQELFRGEISAKIHKNLSGKDDFSISLL